MNQIYSLHYLYYLKHEWAFKNRWTSVLKWYASGMYQRICKQMYISILSEYAEDISPYATFHVQGQGQGQQMSSTPSHMQTFVYHDHRLATMETMQLKNVSNPTKKLIIYCSFCKQ
jgi:hypothetical protein